MTVNNTARIQFYEGTDEPVVPEIRLTRRKDGTTGQALFLFEKPQALSSITEGEITGMRMLDSEGEILTREVKVKFVDCLLYTSDAADEGLGVDLGGRRIIK